MEVEQAHSSVFHMDAQLPPALWEKVPRMPSLAFLPSPPKGGTIHFHPVHPSPWPGGPSCPFCNFPSPAPFIMDLTLLPWNASIFLIPFSEAPLYAQGSQPQSSRFLPLFFVGFAFTFWFPYSKDTSVRRRWKLCRFYGSYVSVTTTLCCDKLKAAAGPCSIKLYS